MVPAPIFRQPGALRRGCRPSSSKHWDHLRENDDRRCVVWCAGVLQQRRCHHDTNPCTNARADDFAPDPPAHAQPHRQTQPAPNPRSDANTDQNSYQPPHNRNAHHDSDAASHWAPDHEPDHCSTHYSGPDPRAHHGSSDRHAHPESHTSPNDTSPDGATNDGGAHHSSTNHSSTNARTHNRGANARTNDCGTDACTHHWCPNSPAYQAPDADANFPALAVPGGCAILLYGRLL